MRSTYWSTHQHTHTHTGTWNIHSFSRIRSQQSIILFSFRLRTINDRFSKCLDYKLIIYGNIHNETSFDMHISLESFYQLLSQSHSLTVSHTRILVSNYLNVFTNLFHGSFSTFIQKKSMAWFEFNTENQFVFTSENVCISLFVAENKTSMIFFR